MYTVEIGTGAKREFRQLRGDIRQRISDKMIALATEPRPSGCKRISGSQSAYRVRVGRYRIVYTVENAPANRVVIYCIAPRAQVYQRLDRIGLG